MNKTKIVVISFSGIVLVLGSTFLYYLLNRNVKVILKDNLDVEVYEDVSSLSFIKKIEKGLIVSSEEEVDTSILGRNDIHIKIKNKFGQEKDYNFSINVVDTKSPTIESENELSTIAGEDFNVLDNVKISDNSKEDIKASIDGYYDLSTPGEYKISIIAKDSSGNESKKEIVINVKKRENTTSKYVMSDRVFTTANGFDAVIKDGVLYVDGILVANKTYSLPSNYGNGLTSETKEAFERMKKAAASEGLNIYISSGFRSYNLQSSIYNGYVSRNGKKEADTYSARAGHSEHQTGLAFDVNDISQAFANTKEGIWLDKNAYKYGFILRYPKDKNNVTGYIYEPWHFRYVGIDLAKTLYNNGKWNTIEEYYGITSEYNY